MFPNPINTYEVRMMEQRELVAAVTEQSRHMIGSRPSRGSLPVFGGMRRVLSAALDRMVMLLPDSRDSLRSKEQELAVVGVTWASDPGEDEMLARQIEAARLRRRLGYPAAQQVSPQAAPGALPAASRAPQLPAVPVHA